MATLAVDPMPQSITTTTAPAQSTSEAAPMRVRDLLISDLAGGAQPPSPDDGFYAAAYFDSADEEAFLRAQRAAFAEINDAALARALQESEILAAQKAAEDNRRRTQAGSGSSSAASASRARATTVTSAPAPSAPATPSPYALVSPSELGSNRSGHSRRASEAPASSTSAHQTTSSSPPPTRSSPPPAPSTQSRSQYYTSAPASKSAYPSSTLSLSSSTSPPPSRIHAAASNTYRPAMPDRQRSSSQQYYSVQNTQHLQHQAKPMMAASHSRRASSTSVPTTATTVAAAPAPISYRQAAPPSSEPPSAIDPSTFYSNLSKTAPSSRKGSISASMSPAVTSSPSSSASRPPASRTVSSASTSSSQATWHPNTTPASIPRQTPHQPSAAPSMPVPMPRRASVSNASTLSTTPTSSSMTARDLRMGILASIPSRAPEVKAAVNKPTPSPPVRSPPVRPKRRRGRRVPTEIEKRAAKAKMFLTSNFGKECEKCGEDVEGPCGSPSIPSEPFSHNLLQHLHVTCSNPACGATYCRGCFDCVDELCLSTHTKTPSPQPCRGSRGCDIKSCCTYASVVALSCILDAFDAECIKAASTSGFPSPASSVTHLHAFVELVLARSDKSTKHFEEVLIRSLHAVSSWLTVFEERKAEYEDDEDDDDDVIDPARHLLHPLITRSLVPAVFCAFLANRNVGDWLKHSEIYVLILEVLRRLVDNGLRRVLEEPIVALEEESLSPYHWRYRRGEEGGEVSESCSSSSAEDSSNSESDKETGTETDATSPDEDEGAYSAYDSEDDKRKTWQAIDFQSPSHRGVAQEKGPKSIKALVTKLEEHRSPLMAFGATVKFPATKRKVNELCDGISYLLLQQVVAFD